MRQSTNVISGISEYNFTKKYSALNLNEVSMLLKLLNCVNLF